MSTYTAFYVRKQAADDETREAVLSLYPKARIEVTTDFIGGVLSDDDAAPPEKALSELSAKQDTDVIWVTCQTTAESFIFHHWRAGKQLRGLWYGCTSEGTWERVEGRAEPWERGAFWDDACLNFVESSSVRTEPNARGSAVAERQREAIPRVMQTSLSPILLCAMLAGILTLAAIVVAFRMRPAKQSRIAFVVAVLPAVLTLALFYSLAVHMRQSLGAWPTSIGERGFPAPLVTHGYVATNFFYAVFLYSIFAWPITFLLCLLVRRWRVCVYYLGLYAFACLLCFGAMLLAPSQFLNWWWD